MNRQARGVRRAHIHFDPDILRRLDERARARGMSRSATLGEIIRHVLAQDQQEKRA